MSSIQQKFEESAKKLKGKELEKLIEEILDSELYITSSFLNYPNIQELKSGNKHYDTLYLFSILTYKDYKNNRAKYLTLNEKLLKKLKCISILEVAKTKKFLEYSFLKINFDIKTNYEIEELLFTLISKDLINGLVNSKEENVSIYSVKPRLNLIKMKEAEELIDKLLDNINDASEFLFDEEKRIKEKTKELNSVLSI